MDIIINGSFGEGGGQIIRTGLSLAAITQKSITINNIRIKRKKPGLRPQHLTACYAVQKICHGILKAELNSSQLTFQPGEITAGNYEFDIGTAGSSILVAQTIIPILLMKAQKSNICIIGGTHVPKSPSYDYFSKIFLPAIVKLGANIKSNMTRIGFYPKGGGIIEIEILPSQLHGNTQWKAFAMSSQAIIRLSKLRKDIAEREEKILKINGVKNISILEDEALSPGNAVTIWQDYKGAYVAGERGKLAEIVAQEAIDSFRQEKGDVDCHLADQLLVYAYLAKGTTQYTTSKITEHLKTNVNVIEKFLPREINIQNNTIIIK